MAIKTSMTGARLRRISVAASISSSKYLRRFGIKFSAVGVIANIFTVDNRMPYRESYRVAVRASATRIT
jgi:hypothetical protein